MKVVGCLSVQMKRWNPHAQRVCNSNWTLESCQTTRATTTLVCWTRDHPRARGWWCDAIGTIGFFSSWDSCTKLLLSRCLTGGTGVTRGAWLFAKRLKPAKARYYFSSAFDLVCLLLDLILVLKNGMFQRNDSWQRFDGYGYKYHTRNGKIVCAKKRVAKAVTMGTKHNKRKWQTRFEKVGHCRFQYPR